MKYDEGKCSAHQGEPNDEGYWQRWYKSEACQSAMHPSYELYVCLKCGHEVSAKEQPEPIKWTDGHVCRFVLRYERKCQSCGNSFIADRPNIDYCDLDCYMASRPPNPNDQP
jgi:DNA-directed RNA polymerase subunit RPC12/RpoP